jgi:hypothetical protein
MVYTSKKEQLKELERQKEKQEEENIRNHIPQGFDFMPGLKKEIECWKNAIVTDTSTGIKTDWPIDPDMAKRHREYEAFLSKIFNSEIGKFYTQIKDDKPE